MTRKLLLKKLIIKKDLKFSSLLLNLVITRLLKDGKKLKASKIIYSTLDLIQEKEGKNPIYILEKAIRNVSPRVLLRVRKINRAKIKVPVLLSKYQSTSIGIKWLIASAREKSSKSFIEKFVQEILNAANGIGNTIKRREELHKMVELNRMFN